MSLHLVSVPLPIDRVNNAISIDKMDANSTGRDFKISTPIRDSDCMEDILSNSLLGFKNKQELLNYRDKGEMIFYPNDNNTIDILFMGDYPKNDTICFVNHLNYEYLRQKNQLDLYEEIPYDLDNFEGIHVKKFKISSNMKNKDIVDSIINESFVGYFSREKLLNFLGRGQFEIKVNDKDTLDFIFIGSYNRDEAKEFVETLTKEYGSRVQELTYEKVLDKIRESNYILESENVDKEDSIVLTLNV